MVNIKLQQIKDVENLVLIAANYSEDIDVIYGRTNVDARSILGVVALMGNHVTLQINTENEKVKEKFVNDIISIGGQCDVV